MLIFGGLAVFRQNLVAFHLADDGQGVNISLTAPCDIGAKLYDLFPILLFDIRIILLVHGTPPVF